MALLFTAILILVVGITLVILSTRKKKPLETKIQPQYADDLEQARLEALDRRLACARWLAPPSAAVK